MMGSKLQRWSSESGKLVILGDAAHAMLPYMSQGMLKTRREPKHYRLTQVLPGAAMAVEDAATLAEALSFLKKADQLPKVLSVFERVRVERTSQMQKASLVNGHIWHVADGPEQLARDEGMRAEVEGRPLDASPNQWSDPVTQAWAYGYDAVKAMRTAMMETF